MRDPRRLHPPYAGKPAPDGAVLADFAARQHGVVARRQLLASGMSRHVVDALLADGHLHPAHRGVFAVGHRTLTRQGRWMAAVLACGEGAALSHRSAAALRGIAAEGARTHVTAPGRIVRPRIDVTTSPLRADEVTFEKGIAVTTVARTLLDLAVVLDHHRLERALHQAEAARMGDATPLPALLDRYPRRAGTPVLRALLDDLRGTGAAVTKSVLEERFRALLHDSGVPLPCTNVHVAGHEVDCLWPEAGLVVELDSRAFHDRSRTFETDRLRDRALHVAGYVVLRITWRELRDRPAAVLADVRAVLLARAAVAC